MAENTTPVTLEVSGFAPREVMVVDYKFNQATDVEGQITGIPRGGRVLVKVKALNDGNNELLQWMLDPTKPLDVKVNFNNTIDGKVMKAIEGKACYCVKYTENWEDGAEHSEAIEFVCQELKNGGATYVNPWK
ncbi:MAG TPA: hypothetical protein DDY68_01915 [Porphyromonadaceae bacterium]|nr:hypothetical protein [Porphyromonadaceae bacterium]